MGRVRKAPANMEETWENIVHTLLETGAVRNWKNAVAPGVWSVTPCIGWPAVAREVAALLPAGCIMPADNRVMWRCGSLWGGSLLDTGTVESILTMRRVVASVRGWEGMESCWSHGRGARLLWQWVGRAAPYPKVRNRHIMGHADRHLYYEGTDQEGNATFAEHGYHDCYPGLYSLREAALLDVSSAYHSLFTAIARDKKRSLRPTVTAGAIRWGSWRGGERERLLDMLEAVAEHRELRQAIWGASIGSYAPLDLLRPDGEGGAERYRCPGSPGPFRALGLIVSRTMKDLTHAQAAAAGSVYANVDSVLIPDSSVSMSIWEAHGLRVSPKQRGAAEVRRRTAWAFWRHGEPRPEDWQGPETGTGNGEGLPVWIWRTKPYQSSDMQVPIPRLPLPDNPVYRQWLS